MGNSGSYYGGTPTYYGPPNATPGGAPPDQGLYFASPGAYAGSYQGTTQLGGPQPAGHYGGKNQPDYPIDQNIIPTGTQGPQTTPYNPNFGMNQVTAPNNNWSGSYLTQGPNTPIPGASQTVNSQPFNGFSYSNPYALGPFSSLLSGAMSPMGISPSWSSGGKVL